MAFVRAVILVLTCGSLSFAQTSPVPRDVDLRAEDGVVLKATYYSSATPGPAVLLLHMCNSTRKSWEPLGPQLAAAGIHALAVDYRGFGESGGDRFETLPPQDAQRIVNEKWPTDIDAAYDFLLAQPDVDPTRAGVAGGSCGVAHAVNVARRHPEVRSLALLAGQLDLDGLTYLTQTPWLPIFAAAAADDHYDRSAPEVMQWILAISGNPRNRFSGFRDGKHGTEIFGPHPELIKQMVAWYADTLVKNPADAKAPVKVKQTPAREFWVKALSPNGVGAAVQLFYEIVQRNPRTFLFPEAQLNSLGYQHLQAGRVTDAIHLFRLNTMAYAASANTWDSLGDAYLANGQNELALRASEKALALLPEDRIPDALKKAIRESAEQKIAKLRGTEKE